MLQQSRNDLPFECFQMEAVNVLTSLASYHETKKRQIDRVFNVLFDNLPEELKKASINDTLEKMLSLARKKLTEEIPENPGSGIEEDIAENHRDIVEDSISDYCDDNADKKTTAKTNLTSTVKKVNPIKPFDKLKLDTKINEQSIIGEEESGPLKRDKYCVGIYYYQKDGSKVEKSLKDLKLIDFRSIHDECADDLNQICEVFIKKGSK